MKLLYIAHIRLPTEKAHGVQIMKTCEAFAHEGVEVELVIPGRKTHITEDPFTYYGVQKNFTLTALNTPDIVPWGFFGFLFSTLWFSEAVKWQKSFWKADVVYSRDAAVLAQYLLLGRKLVYEAHTKPTPVSKFVAKRAYKLIVISEGLRDAYIQAGIDPKKITVAHDAVDLKEFSTNISKEDARKKLNLPKDKSIALYAGHLYASKGVDTLAEAAKQLESVWVYFVGGTEKDIKSFKSKYASVKNIVIVGHRPHKEIPLWMRSADVVVLPNSAQTETSAKYTSPMKLFEYMASGTPIVASDVPSTREILNEKNSTLVESDNPTELMSGISRALNNGGPDALEDVQQYTWKNRASHILKCLKK